MQFFEKIQALRKDRGLSQESFAERIGVSRQAVAKWESGESLPEIDKLMLISDFFMVSIDSLVKDSQACSSHAAPVDLPQAAIGPGMAVFSQYTSVLEANGEPMSVHSALTLINKQVDEALGGHGFALVLPGLARRVVGVGVAGIDFHDIVDDEHFEDAG